MIYTRLRQTSKQGYCSLNTKTQTTDYIYSFTILLHSGREVAVIYGSLPPNTKIAQAAKFNDPNHECKIMVATDAIGMGINL